MRQLGGYTLTTRLGAGGMGEVWKGRRSALGGSAIDVAIKVLSADTVDDLDARKMFLDEARLSMLLTNSNIIKVFDAAETEDKICYLVMEWVDGLDLSELTSKMRKAGERLPDVIIAFIVGEVLKGLAHAHELRHEGKRHAIVHRDVSPQNVMLSVFGEVKIMDFGIARIASEETSGLHIKGKVRYMAPEQLRGMSREPTIDLFAVGAILHELLDGVKFRSQLVDEAHLYGMVLEGQAPPMTRAADTIPKELDELRRGLLAPKPEERIPTAREAFRRLVTWPGYRDARFELDEIVRRVSGKLELQTGPKRPAQTVGQSSVDSSIVEPAMGEVTETEPMPPEVSDTDVARMGDVDRSVAVPVNRQPAAAQKPRNLGLVLLIVGSAIFGLSLGTLVLFIGDDEKDPPSDPVEVAKADEKPDVQEPEPAEAEEELDGPRLDFGARPDQKVADVEPPVEKTKIEPKVEKEPEPPPPEKAKKTKVSIVLDKSVNWAEIKLGSRTFELDKFSATTASTSFFPPGSYNASFRTQVNGPWTQAGKVEVGSKTVTVTLQKTGLVIK